jgi:DNA-cytosine methyltransferase
MNYLSLFSGIEAASVAWHDFGWTCVGFSEIDPFPSAVLKHHYPNVPNLGDITKITKEKLDDIKEKHGTIDIVVGGSPCQSFSVAGKRLGLEDPRGNLMFEYLRIVKEASPNYVLWENVPGVLSSNNGKDFTCFLESLELMGYLSEVELLDAQFFGVPQRRQRIFVCSEKVSHILMKKSTTSKITILKFLLEISHLLSVGLQNQSKNKQINLELQEQIKDGLERRMNLFCPSIESQNYKLLQENLIEILRACQQEQENWKSKLGETHTQRNFEADLLNGEMESVWKLTEESLLKNWEDLYMMVKSFITSTAIKETIDQKIFMCFQIVQNIGLLTVQLNYSRKSFSLVESLLLTALQECMNYAKQKSNEFFGSLWGDDSYRLLVTRSEYLIKLVGCLGKNTSAFEILFECKGSRRDLIKSTEEGQRDSTQVESRTGEHVEKELEIYRKSRRAQSSSDFETWIPADVTNTLNCFDVGDTRTTMAIVEQMKSVTFLESAHPYATMGETSTCSTLTAAMGIGGGHVPMIVDKQPEYYYYNQTNGTCTGPDPVAGTLLARYGTGGGNVPFVMEHHPYNVTFNDANGTRTNGGVGDTKVVEVAAPVSKGNGECWENHDTFTSLSSGGGQIGQGYPAVRVESRVRRLTPLECERLQGFPDNWTKIPYNKKSAEDCPESPRYKALGNSMAVPVMRFIGLGIAELEKAT